MLTPKEQTWFIGDGWIARPNRRFIPDKWSIGGLTIVRTAIPSPFSEVHLKKTERKKKTGRCEEGEGEEEKQWRRDREGGYYTNVRSIVISVSILFGLITEETSVVVMMMMVVVVVVMVLLPWVTLTQHDDSPSIGSCCFAYCLRAGSADIEKRLHMHRESHIQR